MSSLGEEAKDWLVSIVIAVVLAQLPGLRRKNKLQSP